MNLTKAPSEEIPELTPYFQAKNLETETGAAPLKIDQKTQELRGRRCHGISAQGSDFVPETHRFANWEGDCLKTGNQKENLQETGHYPPKLLKIPENPCSGNGPGNREIFENSGLRNGGFL